MSGLGPTGLRPKSDYSALEMGLSELLRRHSSGTVRFWTARFSRSGLGLVRCERPRRNLPTVTTGNCPLLIHGRPRKTTVSGLAQTGR